jgi:hypothetical protein
LYSPKWSKAKKILKGFICESLKDRIDFQIINYRKAHDQLGKTVITVDKKEFLNMCTFKSDIHLFKKEREIIKQQDLHNYNEVLQNRSINELARELIKSDGIYAQYDFFDALEEYFSSPIEKSLKSADMLIKILCLIDRRVGKRTLVKMNQTIKDENEIIKNFYILRCSAQGISSV